MTKISVMIHTASPDDFLKEQKIPSYFTAVTDNLCHQTFKEFEFIYIDRFFEENKEKFKSIERPFVIKHVPIHKNHRYWWNRQCAYISAAKNTGILYAQGELCISFDDAEIFPEHLLNLYWKHYSEGNFLHALHKRFKTIEIDKGLVKRPIKGDVYINDHRLNGLMSPIKYHQQGSLTYAGTSFTLEDAFKLNGFNEKMDGYKSLEDCEFGTRLALLGRTFAMDINGFCYIIDHPSYGSITIQPDSQLTTKSLDTIQKIDNFVAVENYGVMQCAVELKEIEVNKYPLTDRHLAIIKRDTLKYRNFDPMALENKQNFDIWLGCPNFDLREDWEELRKNGE